MKRNSTVTLDGRQFWNELWEAYQLNTPDLSFCVSLSYLYMDPLSSTVSLCLGFNLMLSPQRPASPPMADFSAGSTHCSN